jgi:hypothetical protein
MVEASDRACRAMENGEHRRVGVATTIPAHGPKTWAIRLGGIAGFRTSFNVRWAKYSRHPAENSRFFLQIIPRAASFG